MATFSDAFTLTENPIATNWSTVTGVDGGMRQSGGVAYNATAYEGGSYYDGTTPGNDQWAEAKFPSSSGSGWSAGCGVRYASGSCYLYELDGTNVQMKEVSGGSFSDLGSPAALSFTATDVVRLDATGTTIKVLKNGSEVVSATDSTLTSGTWCMYGWNNYSTGNYLAIDDFNASDEGAGGATTRGNPFNMGNAFNGGRTFAGIIR